MNPFYKYLTEEDKLQEAVIRYAWAVHRLKAIPMNIESNKSQYERFKFKYMGNYKGILDTFLPYPNSKYHGLFIELKTKDRKVFKKDGTLYASGKDTHEAQVAEIERLNKQGYYACFAFGFDQAKTIIDNYIKG